MLTFHKKGVCFFTFLDTNFILQSTDICDIMINVSLTMHKYYCAFVISHRIELQLDAFPFSTNDYSLSF